MDSAPAPPYPVRCDLIGVLPRRFPAQGEELSNKLRALVADVENRITQLAAAGGPQNEAVVGLSRSWALLVAGLDLPVEQKLRACPACKRDIQRAATLCGYCWTRVEPVH